ncbi:class I SAM-dependent methyltransferase [Caulobacter sp. DWR2-3-1b2]|uniref:class I SAM-dependent methyltransferase n=1 Tax=unclassified Caulobacter TaxID=2648921 RepID=UPI003CEE635D
MVLTPTCPICGLKASAPIAQMRFGEKPHLPSEVALHGCADCDFAFTWPRDPPGYRDYYAAVANDAAQRHGQYRNLPQAEILADLIGSRQVQSVLDFGCGGGGLLHVLAGRFPQVDFLGFDVNANFPSDLPNLRFSDQFPPGDHDLLILSHVVEHMADIGQIQGLFGLVGEGGLVHIETPDPKLYATFPQPHFGYYVDRLHINHFSQRAILRIAPQGFDVVAGGTYAMPYALGAFYPAQYVVLRNRQGERAVPAAIEGYLRDEAPRWTAVQAELRDRKFFVYGFGDNFHRSLTPGGPLHCLKDNIIAVIDRNAAVLATDGLARFAFVEPTEVMRIDGALIVCTVSQFSKLDTFFREAYPRSEIRYI